MLILTKGSPIHARISIKIIRNITNINSFLWCWRNFIKIDACHIMFMQQNMGSHSSQCKNRTLTRVGSQNLIKKLSKKSHQISSRPNHGLLLILCMSLQNLIKSHQISSRSHQALLGSKIKTIYKIHICFEKSKKSIKFDQQLQKLYENQKMSITIIWTM